MRGNGRGCLNYFEGLRLCPSLRLLLGGCWEIRLLLRLIYLDAGLRSEVLACFCGVKEEEYSHLFFYCKITWLVWNLCYEWLGISSIAPIHAFSPFLQFRLCNASKTVNLGLRNI